MEEEKEQIKNADIEIYASARAAELKVRNAGKVEISSYSKTNSSEYHKTLRKNLKEDIDDGDFYEDIEIKTIRQVALNSSREDDDL